LPESLRFGVRANEDQSAGL